MTKRMDTYDFASINLEATDKKFKINALNAGNPNGSVKLNMEQSPQSKRKNSGFVHVQIESENLSRHDIDENGQIKGVQDLDKLITPVLGVMQSARMPNSQQRNGGVDTP